MITHSRQFPGRFQVERIRFGALGRFPSIFDTPNKKVYLKQAGFVFKMCRQLRVQVPNI